MSHNHENLKSCIIWQELLVSFNPSLYNVKRMQEGLVYNAHLNFAHNATLINFMRATHLLKHYYYYISPKRYATARRSICGNH